MATKSAIKLESFLRKAVFGLVVLAMFSAIVWTGAVYTGADTASIGYQVGYYGIIALLVSFFALIMFFHMLRTE